MSLFDRIYALATSKTTVTAVIGIIAIALPWEQGKMDTHHAIVAVLAFLVYICQRDGALTSTQAVLEAVGKVQAAVDDAPKPEGSTLSGDVIADVSGKIAVAVAKFMPPAAEASLDKVRDVIHATLSDHVGTEGK